MTDRNHHNRQYTLTDIEQYLQGKLSPAEMHALEKTALSDPFLSDAIEGFHSSDMDIAKNDLSAIQERILQEKKSTRIIPWMRIAAIFILLAGVGSFGWYLLNNNAEKKELAQQNPLRKIADTITIPAPAQQPATGNRLPEAVPPVVPGKKAGDLAVRSENRKKATEAEAELAMLRSKTTAARSAEQAAANRETLTAMDDKVILPEPVAAANAGITRVGNLSVLTVSGSISAGTLSGPVPETALNSITSLGNLSNLTVTGTVPAGAITTRNDLSEVVVTGYRTKSEKRLPGASVQQQKPEETREISPVNGWPAFKNYLTEKTSTLRSRNIGGKLSGMIEAELNLNRRGKVIDVTILSTFNTSLNELLIRLIKDGPDWLLANGKPARGKHKISITL
jgi:hypothetical protein